MLATKFGGNFIINLLGVWAVSSCSLFIRSFLQDS